MNYITITSPSNALYYNYILIFFHKSVTEHQDMHTIDKMIKCASYDIIAAIM